MSNIAIKGATTGTGVFTLESPATNTDRTLVLPDEAGTIDTLQRAGNVLQVVNGVMGGSSSTSSTSYVDASGASATITPSSTSSKILVLVNGQYSAYSVGFEGRGNFQVLRNSTVLRAGLSFGFYIAPDITNDGNTYGSISYNELDSPNTTSALTYKVQFAMVSGAGQVGLNLVSVTLMEIAA